MQIVNIKPLIYAVSFIALSAWFGLIWFNDVDVRLDYKGAIKLVPTALTIVFGVSLVFIKWLWKLPMLQGWLVPIPDLNGTWIGQIASTWVNPNTGKRIAPIPAIVVIDQTFLRCSCRLFTKESSSVSYSSGFIHNVDGVKLLSFSYTNDAKVAYRERSQSHHGTALLKAINKPERSLEGEYWTNRNTVGDLSFKFQTSDKWEKVPDDFGHPNESAD